jgi:DnaJ-domain-containing protein 1
MPDDIKHLRARAEEIRTLADGMNHPAARVTMISIARAFEEMADRFETVRQPASRLTDNRYR